MKQHSLVRVGPALFVLTLCAASALVSGEKAPPAAAPARSRESNAAKSASGPRKYTTETVRGKAVWLDEALERLYGVATEPEAAQTTVVFETADGHLWPLVPDTRGRAFLVDERLRNIELELLVRRYEGVPMLQVIRVARVKPDGRYEIDYWCDICAIPMYIVKPCECCQGETRLRERSLEPAPTVGRP